MVHTLRQRHEIHCVFSYENVQMDQFNTLPDVGSSVLPTFLAGTMSFIGPIISFHNLGNIGLLMKCINE